MSAISTFNAREKEGQGPWKIAVAYHKAADTPYATKMLEFEVTMDFLNGELQEKDEYFGVLNPKGWVLGWLTGGMSDPNFGLIPC